MLVPRALWRPVGAAIGRAAPGPMRAYYRAVARSYVATLRRTHGIRALYTYSSFVGGNFRPGRSDVDFVAVTDAPTPEREVELLLSLRGPFRRHQGLLPIDVWEIPAAEFEDTAAWVTALRPRAAEERPTRSVAEWRLLAGEDLRGSGVWQPDARLAVIGDYFTRRALEYVASRRRPGVKLAYYLAELERDAEREGLVGDALSQLQRSRAQLAKGASRSSVVESAIHATLRVVDEQRGRHSVPREHPVSPTTGWSVPAPSDEAAARAERLLETLDGAAAAALRSATIFLLPLETRPVVLLECAESGAALPLIRWAVSGGGATSAFRQGLGLHLLTSRLAEDAWRNGLLCYSLVGAGRHLFGDALAPRIALPHRRLQLELAHYDGFWRATTVRWALLGHRRYERKDSRVLEVAAERLLAEDEPPILDAGVLMRTVPELRQLGTDDPVAIAALDDAAWGRLALELWRGWPSAPGRPGRAGESDGGAGHDPRDPAFVR
jgi:hypothetical protein